MVQNENTNLIACRRIQDAVDRPDMFITEKKKQEQMGMEI